MIMQNRIVGKPAAKTLAVVAAAIMLQGCVAAIPLAAGGLMAGSSIESNSRDAASKSGKLEAEPISNPSPGTKTANTKQSADTSDGEISGLAPSAAQPVSTATSNTSGAAASTAERAEEADGSRDTDMGATSSADPVAATDNARMDPKQSNDRSSLSDRPTSALSEPEGKAGSVSAVSSGPGSSNASPSPPPAPASPPAAANAAPVEPAMSATTRTVASKQPRPAPNAVTQLLSYANQRQFVSGENRMSAMLADRISLTPKRAECGGVKPAVLIDLDPQGAIFDPSKASNPPAGLGAGLSQLRAQGVHVGWISKNPEERSNLIRRALTRTGLDIYGRDTVLLIRKDDDRKQTLREEFAKTHCLIAIAGDARSDFDELYDYLLDPSEASTLEPLYGEGWFIIPQPLVPQG